MYKSTYSNFHFLISLLFSHRDMMCSIDNSNSTSIIHSPSHWRRTFKQNVLIQSPTDFTIESSPRQMHHAPLPCVVCLTLHRFTKIAERFQTEITTIYSELHTFTSRAQKQHIASLVCITFSYYVCFPFDAHIHNFTKETVRPNSHFQFVQHELTSNNHQQYLPVLHSGLLTATNQLSTGIKQPAHTAQTVFLDCFRSLKLNIQRLHYRKKSIIWKKIA